MNNKSLIVFKKRSAFFVSLILLSTSLLTGCGSSTTSSTSDDTGTSDNTTTVAAAGLYDVVDTNQTTCYNSSTGAVIPCTGTGYDADYIRNAPSYTLTDAGLTVTDNRTGLIWLQTTDTDGVAGINVDDKLSQSSAASYCSTMNLGLGYTWRLPSIKELYSLILFSGEDPSGYTGTDTSALTPFIDDTIFDIGFGDLDGGERIIDGQYVTSTLYVSTTMNGDETVFGVNFVDGRIKGYPTRLGTGDKMFYVRCVTGNTSYGVNKFTDNGNQTITDAATGLMWQKNDSISTDWDDAVSTCENATTGDQSIWRLPNAKELQSIVDYTRSPDTDSSAAIDPIFTSTSFNNEEDAIDWGYYWAATTHVNHTGDGSSAAYLSFGRALGYMSSNILDVHGAGAQRSNDKLDVATTPGVSSANLGYGTFYYHGPQGDVLRHNNKVRCVNSDYLD